MLALIEWQPDIYLDKIAGQLVEQKNISVSLATIQKSLKLLGITTKKVSIHAAFHPILRPCSLLKWLQSAVRVHVKTFLEKLVRSRNGGLYLALRAQFTS